MSQQRLANFDDAVRKLGLQHALGSLRLVKFDSPTLPVTSESMNGADIPSYTILAFAIFPHILYGHDEQPILTCLMLPAAR